MTTVKARPCEACHASIYDLEHVRTRKEAPIDVRPNPRGNCLINIEEGFYTVVTKNVLEVMTQEERQKLHTNHFATCRYAHQFRRRSNAH